MHILTKALCFSSFPSFLMRHQAGLTIMQILLQVLYIVYFSDNLPAKTNSFGTGADKKSLDIS